MPFKRIATLDEAIDRAVRIADEGPSTGQMLRLIAAVSSIKLARMREIRAAEPEPSEYITIEFSRDGRKTWERTTVRRTAPIVAHLTNQGSPYSDGFLDYRWET